MAGFTLIELLVCLAILTLLAIIAVPLHRQSVEKAKGVEAQAALAEVVRLEQLHYANKGSYTSNLQELGFNLYSPLKYTQVFVQVRQDPQGWSYIALATPLSDGKAEGDLWAVARNAGSPASAQSSLPTMLKGGRGSACSVWSGWGSMEGGRIEGEERLSSWSSTTGSGASPCGGKRVVDHGKK
jgi:prepilin-type N-terminal cleavage/methylation domain-containing protein